MVLTTTERLVLRDLEPHDARHILALNSDPEVLRHVHDVPFVDEDAARQWIADIPRYLPNGFGRWAIETREGTWIGRCSLRLGSDGVTLMGYRLLREHWNKGFATEAVRALLHVAFMRFDRTSVVSHVKKGNGASARVLEKCGAQLAGTGPAVDFAEALHYRMDRPAAI